MPAPTLGAVAIKGAIARTNAENLEVVEALMGNVVSAGIGQGMLVRCVLELDVRCLPIDTYLIYSIFALFKLLVDKQVSWNQSLLEVR